MLYHTHVNRSTWERINLVLALGEKSKNNDTLSFAKTTIASQLYSRKCITISSEEIFAFIGFAVYLYSEDWSEHYNEEDLDKLIEAAIEDVWVTLRAGEQI